MPNKKKKNEAKAPKNAHERKEVCVVVVARLLLDAANHIISLTSL
jgi:hypothetical protein